MIRKREERERERERNRQTNGGLPQSELYPVNTSQVYYKI